VTPGLHADVLDAHDIVLIRGANPGAFTLTGTNTYVVGRDPAWIVDPGPLLDEHVDAVLAEAAARGGVGGIAVTHDHPDHVEAVAAMRERTGAPVAAGRGDVDVVARHGDRLGPLEVVATPGHAADHLAFVSGAVALTGDAVLGEGSVFVIGDLAAYLDALRSLRARDLALLAPGHGPVVEDPAAKLDEYVAHRLEREAALVAALADGLRSVDELLDRVWDDAPRILRPAAAVTLGAHLDKLEEEGALPAGVHRPVLPEGLRAP
jgi:glyoxylase-like metal-dependent hydrolase (beta-lactamase superfamily II)